jgi:16S rRNA G966 N2-methylase RsmD
VQSRNGGAPASLDKREGTRAAEGVNNWSANRPTTGDTSVIRTAPTLGWSDCGHDTWRRGHILDPFAGSGTSLAAAAETGRDATGIDIDDRNTWLVRERVGLFLEEVS